ncbi:hypothetical protein M5X11_04680 [Paenibacillus alginolyticus]|uniref:Uncharacterized protein n=1 Tax=Paenibacillus alginolyticus TaxID=59839 RepID=A0ABT4GA03_9BACL|nr:hypothetical protein [Paenibacillus alginolyticus]MCY9664274.1 hypothetical protein [Paenibacillus alginolyticus]MCY9692993.1 hypothetical protein [Paenibacillus alginolyticus]MEC0148880.1 hypothetical protein [Paenibacillus alginolyticus]
METSLLQQQKISAETIAMRIISVKELLQTELDMYEVSKDVETGEHYLHYAYMHRDFTNTGEPESFHYLLPIDSDDVLGLIFGEQGYAYPEHWQKSFLRNGPEGFYIWFDPSHEVQQTEDDEIAQDLLNKLRTFREKGNVDPEAVRKLLEELDETRNKKE